MRAFSEGGLTHPGLPVLTLVSEALGVLPAVVLYPSDEVVPGLLGDPKRLYRRWFASTK